MKVICDGDGLLPPPSVHATTQSYGGTIQHVALTASITSLLRSSAW